MRLSEKNPDGKPSSQTRDPISAFRGAGKRRYTTDKLVSDRKTEREEEDTRKGKPIAVKETISIVY